MFNKIIPLKDNDDKRNILCLNGILKQIPFFYNRSVLKKTGEHYEFEKFENKIQLFPLIPREEGEIDRINYAKFANDVLNEINNYRLIRQNVYRNLGSYLREIKTPGEYVIASEQIPQLKILVHENKSPWAYDSLEIISFDNKEILKYLPRNLKEPQQFPDEILIQGQLKRDSVLNKTYKGILNYYSKNN